MAFRCYASPEIGSGYVVRCLTLARTPQTERTDCIFHHGSKTGFCRWRGSDACVVAVEIPKLAFPPRRHHLIVETVLETGLRDHPVIPKAISFQNQRGTALDWGSAPKLSAYVLRITNEG